MKKLALPEPVRDAALIGLFIFLWNVNAELASIRTTLELIKSGNIKIASTK